MATSDQWYHSSVSNYMYNIVTFSLFVIFIFVGQNYKLDEIFYLL